LLAPECGAGATAGNGYRTIHAITVVTLMTTSAIAPIATSVSTCIL
jgi:hypothetical protein